MKWFLVLSSLLFSDIHAQDFQTEAKNLADDLKESLMKNLSEKISKDGVVEAVSFCHLNVKPIAKADAADRIKKYEFGRTSHKIRNADNAPQPWAEDYLKEFEGKKKGEIKMTPIIFKLDNGKRVYLRPLYVEAKCLLCHGENVSKNIHDKIQELYPKDKAVGFKLNEFRGFIWVKEK